MIPTEKGFYWLNDEIVLVTETSVVSRFGSSSVEKVDSLKGEWSGPIKRKVATFGANLNADCTSKTL